nr:unnamed protein product [Spirometra erinaceieuropaei]
MSRTFPINGPRGLPFVGVFSGSGKPEPLDIFLGQCISELKNILTSGLQVPDTDDVVRVELANVSATRLLSPTSGK